MTIQTFNLLDGAAAHAELIRCCGSREWANRMIAARPFTSIDATQLLAEKVWVELDRGDYLEAFSHHPRIGDGSALRAKFAATADWAADEQKGTRAASENVLRELARLNQEYEIRFGHVFLIFATGKSAAEMLEALRSRVDNDAERELEIAAGEQKKITRLRLEKLFL